MLPEETPTYKGLLTLGLLHTHTRTALILLSIIVLSTISIERYNRYITCIIYRYIYLYL